MNVLRNSITFGLSALIAWVAAGMIGPASAQPPLNRPSAGDDLAPRTQPVLIDDVGDTNAKIGVGEAELDPEIAKWEDDVAKLEAEDAKRDDPADGVLFIGSSSIRLWKHIARDMAPYRTIRRGYGGAKFSDLSHYAKRLIRPHTYRALVIFVGNDVSGKENDHSPDQVEAWVKQVLQISRQHQPDAPVLLVEVTPTPARFDAWPEIRELNARLREIALTHQQTYFVATAGHYLDDQAQPREELFVKDRLHQNERGYALWSTLIRRRLDDVFRALADSP